MTDASNTESLRQAEAQLGRTIRAMRKARKLSPPAFALHCKLHVSHLNKIERGQVNPSLQTLLAIAKALGVSPSNLFSGIQDTDTPGDEAKAS